MKILITIACTLSAMICIGQAKPSGTVVIDLITPYKPALISLFRDTVEVAYFERRSDGSASVNEAEAGNYNLFISVPGKPMQLYKSFAIQTGQKLEIRIKMGSKCLYDHTGTPRCPENHADSIIPILYGLPVGKVDTNKVYLGGCVVTDCDPKYFCTIHKKEF